MSVGDQNNFKYLLISIIAFKHPMTLLYCHHALALYKLEHLKVNLLFSTTNVSNAQF